MKSIGLTSKRARVSPWARRVAGLGALGITAAAFTALYACSGDDNSTTPPPVNDAVHRNPDGGNTRRTRRRRHRPRRRHDEPRRRPDGDGGPARVQQPPGHHRLHRVGRHAGAAPQGARSQAPRQREHHDRLPAHRLVHALAEPLQRRRRSRRTRTCSTSRRRRRTPTWTTANAERTCTTDPNNGTPPNLGISALFPSSCAGLGAPPAGIGNFNGPIQAYTFIVPTAEFATQTAITAAEALLRVRRRREQPRHLRRHPRVERTRRSSSCVPRRKSTLVATALNIGLTAQADDARRCRRRHERRAPAPRGTSSAGARRRSPRRRARRHIGILGDEVYDANRGKGVNVLAFQALRPERTRTTRTRRRRRSTSRTSATATTRSGRRRCTSRRSTERRAHQPGREVHHRPRPRQPEPDARRTAARPIDGLGHRRQRGPHPELRDAGAARRRRRAPHGVHAGRAVHLLLPQQGPRHPRRSPRAARPARRARRARSAPSAASTATARSPPSGRSMQGPTAIRLKTVVPKAS